MIRANHPFICLFIFMGFNILPLHSQQSFWQEVNEIELRGKSLEREIVPTNYLTKSLDLKGLAAYLGDAPNRYSQKDLIQGKMISIPLPNGTFERFEIFQSGLLPPELQAKYPQINPYTGYSVENRGKLIKLDITQKGFHAMILSSGDPTVFIDPYTREQNENYIIYYSKDYVREDKKLECGFTSVDKGDVKESDQLLKNGDCQFREYTLALACTGEYTAFHFDSDSVADAMAAMTTTMNRVNGVFERDAGLTMVFVTNNDTLIFTDASSDPYTNSNGSAMLGENQTTCDARIGSANYDIGHVFSTGGGGVAYLNAPCNNSIKAGGVTGQNQPIGDPFDIDYVAHEMGHQYGAKHTQNNSCNRSPDSSYEPGSASTIMGYAGICSPNVQNNSDDYFHAISLSQIASFTTGSGNSCASIIDDTNTKPNADPVPDYSIPISTPFLLEGSAFDADSDPLTYCWEQWDREVATMPPVSTSTVGPAFRTFDPVSSPTRSFPRRSVVNSGGTDTWEVLPSVSRDLNFRLTVRDNNSAYGCTDFSDMTVSTIGSAGPFLITSQNTSETWTSNTTETITWDVANTDGGSVNCANVDIQLSVDGGESFTYDLALNTANDGTEDITVPDVTSGLVRIRVMCSNNIFYDVNDANILIGVTEECVQVASTDTPISISPNGRDTIYSTIALYQDAEITDVNIIDLEGTHTWVGDLKISISDPGGNKVTLIDGQCGSDDDFDVNLDDSGGVLPCPYTDGLSYAPAEALSSLNNNLSRGDWILEIIDEADGDGGQLTTWDLEVCYIKTPCVPSAEIPTTPGVYTGNYECEDDQGWTHFMHITEGGDTLLLLSIDKGSSGVELYANELKVEVLAGSTAIDLSTAPYVTAQEWYVMRRYWDATPTTQPSTPIPVRFYYSTTDFNEITASDLDVAGHEDLSHYKITGTDDPDPSTGHTGVMSNEYSEPTYLYSNYNSHHQAEYTISSFSGGGGGGSSATGGVVPVELISFEAYPVDEGVSLEWKTGNEINNEGFAIERSASNAANFERIGFIEAVSIQKEVNAYSWVDKGAPINIALYYRLRQVDLDGSFEYSPVRTAVLNGNGKRRFSIYPNPSSGLFTISQNEEVNGEYMLELMDIHGAIIQSYKNVSKEEITIDLSSYPSGNYLVRIVGKNSMETFRVVKY